MALLAHQLLLEFSACLEARCLVVDGGVPHLIDLDVSEAEVVRHDLFIGDAWSVKHNSLHGPIKALAIV